MLLERNAIVQLEGPPTVLDRGAFEEALAAQAIAAGAKRIARDLRDFSIEDGHWNLKTGEGRIKAGFVFDATGRKALVASRFSTRFQADKLCCQYGLFICSYGQTPRPVTLIEAEANGWWYLSLLDDRRVILNFYSDPDLHTFDAVEFEPRARGTKAISAYLAV